MRILMIILICLLAMTIVPAQTRYKGVVRGTVIDSTTRHALMEAPVSLLHAKDSSLVTYTITGGEGSFIFRNIPEGNYRILITFLGYRNISKVFSLTDTSPEIDLDTLQMQQLSILLDEVTITQERAPITVKADTLEFNAQSFQTQPNAQVEELLKKLPGMEVSRDGTIRAQGQEVKRVLVDGKPFFGDDPKVATRNLPAEIIESVQLFDQQSDQASFSGFDDGTREKTINLTTKKDKRKGIFGQNSAGAGTNGRYQAQLSLNRFNNEQQLSLLGMGNNINQQGFTIQDMFNFGQNNSGSNANGNNNSNGSGMESTMLVMPGRAGSNNGVNGAGRTSNNITESWAGGVNFRDKWGKKIDVNGSYFLNHSNINTAQNSRRQNILPDTTYFNEQENQSTNLSNSHRLNFRIDYKLDSLNSIRFTPSITVQNSTFNSLSNSSAFTEAGIPLNQGRTENNTYGDGIYGNNNLLYMRKFNKPGRTFSLNLNTILNGRNTTGTNHSSNFFYEEAGGKTSSRIFNQQNDQKTNTLTNNINLSYTEPLSLRNTLEFHYAYGNSINRSDREVYDYSESTGSYDVFNEELSNEFRSSFTTQRAGFHIQTRRLKYTYSIGIDLQQAGLRNDNQTSNSLLKRNFTNLLPNAQYTYNFSANRSLRINYRARINPPSVSQLQPVPDNTNPLHILLGNTDLKPEYMNNLTAVYNSFQPTTFRSVFAVLNVSQTTNKIVNESYFDNLGAQTTRPVNKDGNYSANGFVVFGRPIRSKSMKANLNVTTNVNYNRGISLVNDQSNYANSFLIGQGLNIHSNFNEKLEFGMGGNINYQMATYSLQSQQNTQFFNKTLTFDLYYQLPFHFVITSDLTYNNNSGRSAGYNQNFVLWNAGIARQFFKNKQGELKLSVYDILNQNRSIVRNVGDTYVEDVQSQVLKQYFMLSFTYHLRKFGGNLNDRSINRPFFMRPGGS